MPAEPHLRPVVVTEGAGELRRELGPTAWVVLEVLVACADETGRIHARACDIATFVGLNADTVQRAVRRLHEHDLVTSRAERVSGRFDGTVHSLEIKRRHCIVSCDPTPKADRPDTAEPGPVTTPDEHAAGTLPSEPPSTPRASREHSSTTSLSSPSLFEA